MTEALDFDARDAEFSRIELRLPRVRTEFPRAALAWAALCPAWPEQLARGGFPVGTAGLETGDSVGSMLRRMQQHGLLEAGPGEAPWRGTWYWMPSAQRTAVLDTMLSDGDQEFIRAQLRDMGHVISRSARGALPPALNQFAVLAHAASDGDMGRVLEEHVRQAVDAAEATKQIACPEALRWIESAEALVRFFPGDLEIALARVRRRHELFLRRSRDARYLAHYTERPKLEQAFLDLLQDSANDSWGLHYWGEGGMGKTMLVRRITSDFARDRDLVTSRIDFDYVNPDYPARAPGLLLQTLADDLRLNDDDRVEELLRKFSQEIEAVHRRIEARIRTGNERAVLVDEARLNDAMKFFVAALRAIAERRRPVLILDTCEELTRLRPNGELSDAVLKTFTLLEELHAAVPSLRVVFSGRRPLTSQGLDRSFDQTTLEPRRYLRVARVLGFDDEEADRFLDEFREKDRIVDPRYRPGIKAQSRVRRRQATDAAQSTSEDPEERYNPYDLSLYASWIATAENVDIDALLASGTHLYVRERIVLRLSPFVQPWLPVLALLGHFDRRLLGQIARQDEQSFAAVYDELTAQEWVDIERAAMWSGAEQDETREQTWVVDRNIRTRLEAFYQDTDPDAWRDARKRLRRVVADITCDRRWARLTPGYFALAFDLLSDDPRELAEWWKKVERKIVDDGAWNWGAQVVQMLPVSPTDEDLAIYPGASAALSKPLRAAVCATDAAIKLHQRVRGHDLQSLWLDVAANVDAYAIERDRDVLRYRAAAGVVAGTRYLDAPLTEGYVHELEEMLGRVPPMPHADDSRAARELQGTELGLIENTVEILEAVEWVRTTPPPPLIATLQQRLGTLSASLPADMAPPVSLLRARMARLVDADSFLADTLAAFEACENASGPEGQFLDWTCAADGRQRFRLELLRLARDAGPGVDSRIRAWRREDPEFSTLDGERSAAALLRLRADVTLPDDPPEDLIRQSVAADVKHHSECRAHREVPPYFQVALEARANRGDVDRAVEQCLQIAGQREYPLSTRQAADRALVRIVNKWRLQDLKFGRETSIHQSTATRDRLLTVQADALFFGAGPSRPPADVDLDHVLSEGSSTDRDVLLWRNVRDVTAPSAPLAGVRDRRYAEVLLANAGVDSVLRPKYARGCAAAASRVLAGCNDPVGEFLAATTAALLAARANDRDGLQEAFDRARATLRTCVATGFFAPEEHRDRAPHSLPQIDTDLQRQLPSPLHLPWLFRLLACRVRLNEFAAPGPQTAKLLEWAIAEIGDVPADCDGVLAPTGDQSAREKSGRSPKIAPPPASFRRPPTQAAQRPARNRLALVGTVLVGILGAVFALAVFWGLYRAFEWTLARVGMQVDTWLKVVLFFVLILLIGSWQAVVGVFLRGWLRTVRYSHHIVRSGAEQQVSAEATAAPNRADVSFESTYLRMRRFAQWKAVDEPPDRWERPYLQRSGAARLKVATFAQSVATRLSLKDVFVDVVLHTQDACSAEPWEALLVARTLEHSSPLALRLRFRRTATAAGSRDVMAPVLTGNVPRATMLMSQVLRSSRTPALSKARLEGVSTSFVSFARTLAPGMPPDPSVVIAIMLCEAVSAESGLMLQFDDGFRVFPHDVCRAFPNLRLCVLEHVWRADHRRIASDPIDAARLRLVASRLHYGSVPAVLVIPPVPAETGAALLTMVTDALATNPRRATRVLNAVTHDIRLHLAKTIATALPPESTNAPVAHTDAVFDVCLYCADGLSLEFTPDAAPPAAQQS